MAQLRVFVSSTCYDLSLLRAQLRIFLKSLGYEPIMSDYADILYDPRIHTHTSCVDEVGNADMLILIIGSRFGGKAVAESLNRIDFESMKSESAAELLKAKDNISITQLEVLMAIEKSIPVYTFIDKRVFYDHALYEKNKASDIIEKIAFPSIEKQETAKYIFNFIDFIRLRTKGNNIFSFEKGQDIEEVLKKQWSNYFQRLLHEQREAEAERKQIDILGEKFEDLKTAILSSISNSNQRVIARGIVKFRRLFDLLQGFKTLDNGYLKDTSDSWEMLLKKVGVTDIIDAKTVSMRYPSNHMVRSYFVLGESGYYESIWPFSTIEGLPKDWSEFVTIGSDSRQIILEALSEMQTGFIRMRYIDENFYASLKDQDGSDNESIEFLRRAAAEYMKMRNEENVEE